MWALKYSLLSATLVYIHPCSSILIQKCFSPLSRQPLPISVLNYTIPLRLSPIEDHLFFLSHFLSPSSPPPGISFLIWLKRTFLLSTFTSSFPRLLHIIHCSLAVSPQIFEVTDGLLLDSFLLTYFPLIILWIMDTVPYNSEILSSCTLIPSLTPFNSPKVVSLGFFSHDILPW